MELRLDAYVLSVPASLVLNDPLRELFDLLACDRLSPHAFRRTCLWQEPKGHAVDVEKLWDDRLMLSVCFDTDFVPPMTGRAMDLVYRCLVEVQAFRQGVAGGLAQWLESEARVSADLRSDDIAAFRLLLSQVDA